MAARTAIVPQQGARDAGTTLTFSSVDASNGNTIAAGPFHIIIAVKNADASTHTVTVRACGNGVTASGGTATGDPDYVFAAASKGDLVVTCAASSAITYIPIFETDRFTQLDGSLSLDWSSGTSMTVAVVQYPSISLGF